MVDKQAVWSVPIPLGDSLPPLATWGEAGEATTTARGGREAGGHVQPLRAKSQKYLLKRTASSRLFPFSPLSGLILSRTACTIRIHLVTLMLKYIGGSMQELTGATIEHYSLQHHLARGGMSEIYLASDSQTQQTVAIKVVHRSNTD